MGAVVIAAAGAAAPGSLSSWAASANPSANGEPSDESEEPPRSELNLVPLVGGDSDVGIGFGEVGDWARLQPNAAIYRWRLENAAFISFKLRDDDNIIVPFQDYYWLYTRRNHGAEKRWQLDVRLSFTNETTLKFYGFGNATPPPPSSLDVRETEFGRIHPTFAVERLTMVVPHVYLKLGSVYTHNWLSVPSDGTLAEAAVSTSPAVRQLLGDFRSHGVELLEFGIEYDSRDSEIVTHDGSHHMLQARISPRVPGWLPYQYEQIDLTLRFFTTPIPRWLTIASRAVGDVLLGTPPFYELARFDETAAIGGTKAVRGVPAQRYYGKVKLFGNLELRSELFPFQVRQKQFVLGVATFFDTGRVWTELGQRHPELDGGGWGLKYGVGGGLRLQEGETFVVRVDLAWSPDATPVGAYFAAGQIF